MEKRAAREEKLRGWEGSPERKLRSFRGGVKGEDRDAEGRKGGGQGGMHVCAQFNKCSLPSVPFLGSTWLRRRETVTLPLAVLFSALPPFLVPAPRVSLIRMQSRRTSRASSAHLVSGCAVQIYDSRDFYLIPHPPSPFNASQYSFLSERISRIT